MVINNLISTTKLKSFVIIHKTKLIFYLHQQIHHRSYFLHLHCWHQYDVVAAVAAVVVVVQTGVAATGDDGASFEGS